MISQLSIDKSIVKPIYLKLSLKIPQSCVSYCLLKIKKCWTHEIPRKKLRPAKYPREKILYPQNIHEKKCEAHEIPTRKYFGPQNTHEKNFRTHQGPMARWYETRDSTRSTEFSILVFIILSE